MPTSILAHLKHHGRFYVSALLGIAVWTLTILAGQKQSFALAGDVFFGVYLLSMMHMTRSLTAKGLRKRAASRDEGIGLIILIALGAISLSLGSIFLLLGEPRNPEPVRLALSLASVPLGWITLHTIMAFHYAHLYYSEHPSADYKDKGGLDFPATSEPASWDFLYYSFVVGMTAQVSDVQVQNTHMRRVTLSHGVVSFFFNTVILALAVNIVLGQGR